jgi:nitrite reductase/ring-hydroxylating ferredoxin subunit
MSDESRRSFLKTGGACLAGAMGLCLGLPAELAALPIRWIDGTGNPDADRTYPVPAADGVNIDKAASLILVRSKGRVYAFALSCPHEGAAVRWVEKNTRFECTKHNSKYVLEGVYISGRATRNLDRFPIRREGNNVIVDNARVFRSDKDAAGWAAASVAV